jgi:DMSO/TMAO reductase YedYZ heme-binding membrane subunit
VLAAAANSSKAYWYLTRSTGVVALVLLTLSVAFGIAQVSRWSSPRWPRFVIAGLHKNISLLVVVFLGVHIATAVLDSFAPIHWLDAIIPFQSAYRPVWLGLGALSFDLIIALTITSLLRTRMGYRSWRAVHWLAYASWPIALVHSLGTGSDTHVRWMLAIDVACVLIVVAATLWRIGFSNGVSADRRWWSVGATAAVVVAMLVWTAMGPLQSGWARRSGTPVSLLGSKRIAASSGSTATTKPRRTSPSTAAVAELHVPLQAGIKGTLTQTSDSNGGAIIVIDGQLRDGASGRVHVALQGNQVSGGVEMRQSRAYLGTAADPSLYTGTVTQLSGTHVVADLSNSQGKRVELVLDVSVNDAGNGFTGNVQVNAA